MVRGSGLVGLQSPLALRVLRGGSNLVKSVCGGSVLGSSPIEGKGMRGSLVFMSKPKGGPLKNHSERVRSV